MAKALKIVTRQEPAAKPLLSNKIVLKMSRRLWPEEPINQRKWLKAVDYLQNRSQKGWTIEKYIDRVPEVKVL
jgi:hypothetical protein